MKCRMNIQVWPRRNFEALCELAATIWFARGTRKKNGREISNVLANEQIVLNCNMADKLYAFDNKNQTHISAREGSGCVCVSHQPRSIETKRVH